MVSVIICSKSLALFTQVEQNIQATAGVPVEIIRIDNTDNDYSICQAYNAGAEKATYPFLCFVHEDVTFKTHGWPATLAGYFETNSKLGVLGLGGSLYKSSFPSGWGAFDKSTDFVNIQMPSEDGTYGRLYNNPAGKNLTEALVVDGVLMFTTKKIWQEVKFNEAVTGFHFYDIDFCLRLFKKGYKAAVENTITVIHASRGRLDDNWAKASLAYHKQNKQLIESVSKEMRVIKKNSDEALQTYWLKRFSKYSISLKNRLKLVLAYKFYFTKSYLKTCYRFIKYPVKQV